MGEQMVSDPLVFDIGSVGAGVVNQDKPVLLPFYPRVDARYAGGVQYDIILRAPPDAGFGADGKYAHKLRILGNDQTGHADLLWCTAIRLWLALNPPKRGIAIVASVRVGSGKLL
jgi:hypothetical protein